MARGFMSNLSAPAFLVDHRGVLVFYNEAAEQILGITFAEVGPIPAQDWNDRFEPTSADGTPVPVEDLPLGVALREERPAHGPLRIKSASGHTEAIEATAFPVIGRGGLSGALAIFWRTGN